MHGNWWFFLVPVKAIKQDSLSSLLVGDNVAFSYINNLNVISLNGVSCWQQDFKIKNKDFDEMIERKIVAKLKNGDIYVVPNNELMNGSVDYIKDIFGDIYNLTFSYRGSVHVKVGVKRDGYSFEWVAESSLKSLEIADASIPIDLAKFESGTVEVTVFALSNARIYTSTRQVECSKDEIESSKVLYDFLFPSIDVCCEEPLYCRFSGKMCYFGHDDSTVHLFGDSSVDFLTYFNSFSISKWFKYTNVKNLSVYLDLKGEVEVTVEGQYKTERFVIDRFYIKAEERGTYVLPVSSVQGNVVLGVSVRNLSKDSESDLAVDELLTIEDVANDESLSLLKIKELRERRQKAIRNKNLKNKNLSLLGYRDNKFAEIYGGGWITGDPETQDVSLGLVVTTCFREQETVARLSQFLQDLNSRPFFRERVSVAVVDNAGGISEEMLKGVLLIQGSITSDKYKRMYPWADLSSESAPSYCLFMDDDSLCEFGTFYRTIQFFRHVTDLNVAVCGSRLSDKIKFIQVERASWFDGTDHPLNADLDLRDPVKLYENEQESDGDLQKFVRGDWRYFCIPTAVISSESLESLSGGNCADFTSLSRVAVVSVNGICCWQSSFKVRNRLSDTSRDRKVIALLKNGDIYPLPKGQLVSNSVSIIREVYGDLYNLKFSYQGTVNVKVGISREGYSFKWIAEKMFDSAVIDDAEIPLDLSEIENGTVEVTFFALSDARIFKSASQLMRQPSVLDNDQVLYDFLYPSFELCSEEPLYVKFSDGLGFYSHEDRTIHLYDGSAVDFLTYFNSFSAMKWKKYTNVRSLSVYLDVKGAVEVSVLAQYKNERIVLDQYVIVAKKRGTYVLPVSSMQGNVILGVKVKNLSLEDLVNYVDPETLNDIRYAAERKSVKEQRKAYSAEIFGGGWLTEDPKLHDVSLGVVITAYKRDDEFQNAVARLVRDVSKHPNYKDVVDIAVVDNGNTLSQDDVKGAFLITNSNEDGTGGFLQGFSHFRKNGEHTHCLFIDDDANCEAGAIFRSMSFQRHASESNVALSGSLLSEKIKFIQVERASWYDGKEHSLNVNFDLRDSVKLYENEQENDDELENSVHGDWRYFLIPAASVSDKSLESLAEGNSTEFTSFNNFDVVSLNGVCCWQSNFKVQKSLAEASKERRVVVSLRKGEIFPLPKELIVSSVNIIKEVYGGIYNLRFSYKGNVNVKVGISREGYSFKWIAERMFDSSVVDDAVLPLDLSEIETGTVEVTFFALSDVTVFNAASQMKQQDTELDANHILYDFLYPSFELCSEEPLYMKFSDGLGFFSHEDRTVHLYDNAAVDFLTYFNSFSAMKWFKYTNVRNLSVYLDLKGYVEVSILAQYKNERVVLEQYVISARKRGTYVLPISSMKGNVILGVKVRNLSLDTLSNYVDYETLLELKRGLSQTQTCETEIYGGGWLTDDPETQDVRLGITITTFKREKEVKAAVRRLVRDISSHAKYSDMIDIAVVDNGNTLTASDVKGANLITNRNLGGTGGFTRGLIHFQETGKHTHCLFMDDDASCEAGAIFRSMSFQRHVTDHKVALSGAMLFENIKFMQWENGAWFDGGCHSIKRDFDMRDPVKLFENEEDVDLPIYGAWWFFFFPLDEARNYSLPFFVRGDDIDFSYANDFRVVSLNGVSCWQQDFKTKENAMTAYLFLRSHIVHHMTVPTLKCSYKIMMRILWGHFREYNNSYFYGTAACVNLAMKHVLMGPKFWEDNIVPVEVLKKIKELSACEKPVPYTESELKELGLALADRNIKTRIFPVTLRKLSMYGHLLPGFMIKNTEKDMLPKWMTPNKLRTYMRSQITVLDELNRTRTVLKRSPCAYFRNLLAFVYFAIRLKLSLRSLQKKYMKAMPRQRTREFWKEQFKPVSETNTAKEAKQENNSDKK